MISERWSAQFRAAACRTCSEDVGLPFEDLGGVQGVGVSLQQRVCYLQSADKYTPLLTRDAELLLRTPLMELIAQLDPEQFWQVHRGTVANVRQIVAAQHGLLGKLSLSLRERPEKIAVSRSYAHIFRQR